MIIGLNICVISSSLLISLPWFSFNYWCGSQIVRQKLSPLKDKNLIDSLNPFPLVFVCTEINNHVTLPQQTRTCMRLTVKSDVMIFDLAASKVEERRRGEGRSSPSELVRLHIVVVNGDSVADDKYSIRTKDPNNYSDTEMGTLSRSMGLSR